MEATQTTGLLPDVAAAVINGLSPTKDAIYLETVKEGSGNIIVARPADKDNPLYQKVVSYFRSDEVAKVLEDTYYGGYLPSWQ